MDNALSLIKLGALDGLSNNCIDNASMHDLIYLSKLQLIKARKDGRYIKSIYFVLIQSDDAQINAKSNFNGTNMSKIEPIDDDQDYQDADILTSEAANYKDDDDGGGGGGDGGSGDRGGTPIDANNSINDSEKGAIDSKPSLGSLNHSSANIDDANETNANDRIDQQHQRRRNSVNLCNTSADAIANETNLNDSETIDRGDIDNKLAPATTSTQNGMLETFSFVGTRFELIGSYFDNFSR